METWKIQELDELTDGDVALRIFQAQKQLDKAAENRAAAARTWSDAKHVLEKAEATYSTARYEEDECSRELENLKKYLEMRLNKEETSL